MIEGLAAVGLIAALAIVIGLGFGIVVAPRITRWLDRAEADDEDAGDRTD